MVGNERSRITSASPVLGLAEQPADAAGGHSGYIFSNSQQILSSSEGFGGKIG
jgi:hypothetical protein